MVFLSVKRTPTGRLDHLSQPELVDATHTGIVQMWQAFWAMVGADRKS
jgi:hypothetical protein